MTDTGNGTRTPEMSKMDFIVWPRFYDFCDRSCENEWNGLGDREVDVIFYCFFLLFGLQFADFFQI